MPGVCLSQHLYSSVERGYSPVSGRGFQTVGVSQDLAASEDLKALEKVSYYAVGRDRRRSGVLPIKETFLKLPSGRFAVGRIVDWGSDSLGREGNYLARHVVFDLSQLQEWGSPFALLDALAAQTFSSDLTPGLLPPLELEPQPVRFAPEGLDAVSAEVLAGVTRAFVDGAPRPLLLVGDEAVSRSLLRALFAAVVPEERQERTFSTHFYESDHLRGQFSLVTVDSRGEAPAGRQHYLVFDLESGESAELPKPSDYAEWLGGRMAAHDWEEIRRFNTALAALRGTGASSGPALPESPGGKALLWKWEREPLVTALRGRPAQIARFLHEFPNPAPLAQALLAYSPPELCGGVQPSEATERCLAALRAARSRDWSRWVQQWVKDPLLASFTRDADPWWKKAMRKLPGQSAAEPKHDTE